MRKIHILKMLAIACMAFATPAYADEGGEKVELKVSNDDPTIFKGGLNKLPARFLTVQIPSVFLEDYTLYFETPCNGCTLQLLDENKEVVYAVVLPTGTTQWELPNAFEGEYKLKIICGRFCFSGCIEL